MNKKEINFVPNEKDNLHCFQACFKMVLEYFTSIKISMKEAELLTNFVPGRPTWPYKGILSWAENDLFIRYIENFPNKGFISDPSATIKNHIMDDKIAEEVIRQSDLTIEVNFVQDCLKHPRITFEEKVPTINDIFGYIELGCLVVVNVNYWALLEKPDYSGHFIIVTGIKDNTIFIQNPGLPPIQNQEVSIDKFIHAWQYPNEKLANLIVINNTPC